MSNIRTYQEAVKRLKYIIKVQREKINTLDIQLKNVNNTLSNLKNNIQKTQEKADQEDYKGTEDFGDFFNNFINNKDK